MYITRQKIYFFLINLVLINFITITLLAAQLQATSSLHRPIIIWDLGGVALQTDYKKAVSAVGLKNIITSLVAYKLLKRGFHPADAQKHSFTFMDWRRGCPPHTAAYNGSLPLPLDMREVMKGQTTSTAMVAAVCADCDAHSDYFVKYHNSQNSAREIVKGTMRCMLPENLVEIQAVNPKVLKLIRACKQTGNCRLLILSNWDKESGEPLIASKPELFENFKREDITFSGQTGYMKPEPDIYAYITNKYGINPSDCVLIDDQPENIIAAQAAGWQHSFIHTNAANTEAELTRLGVLGKNGAPSNEFAIARSQSSPKRLA